MRIHKLLWSMLLAAVLFCTSVYSISPLAAAFSDTEGTKYAKAVSVLSDLGIVEGRDTGEFDPAGNLTRAEMVATIVRVVGLNDWQEERDCFTDVPYEHWAYYQIVTAYSLGIINGVSETEFMPDASVTGVQAVKMVVNLLGYTVKAEALGGYPAGYLSCAASLGILNGADKIDSGEICRGDMAILLYNALDTGMLVPEGYGEDSYAYQEDMRCTPLSYYLHINIIEGVVTATYAQEIAAPEKHLRADEIVLAGKAVGIGETDADKRLGEYIMAYVKEGEDGRETMLGLTSKSTVTTVPGNTILSETTGSTLCFERDGKIKRVSVSGATVIVNGEPQPTTAETLQPETGIVKLIARGNSVEYVVVESYENYVVERTAMSTMTVTVRENRTPVRTISFDNEIPTVFTLSDGTAADISKCAEWDVLALAESPNGKYRKVIVTSNIVPGTLSEISAETVKVGETEYPVAKSLLEMPDFEMPPLGTEAEFSLDMHGRIAAVNTEKGTGAYYAWLINAAFTKGMDPRPQLRLFTHEGKVETLDCTDKVELNGQRGDAAVILGETSPLKSNGEISQQLIKYKKNGDKISSIETATDYRYNYDDPGRTETFSLDAYIKPGYRRDDGTNEYTIFLGGEYSSFGRGFLVRSETIIFVIPGSGEEKDYYIKAWNSMQHGTTATEQYDDIAMYDVTEDEVVSVLVWDRRDEVTTEALYPSSSGKMALVKNVSIAEEESSRELLAKLTVITESGNSMDIIADMDMDVPFGEASTNRNEDPVCVDGVRPSKVSVMDIEPGDIIHYEADASNKAYRLSVIFRGNYPANYEKDSNAGVMVATTKRWNYGNKLMSYGEVYDFGKYGFLAMVNLYDANLDTASHTSVKTLMHYTSRIYMVNTSKNTIKTIGKDEVEIGDKILSVSRTYTPLMTIIYR